MNYLMSILPVVLICITITIIFIIFIKNIKTTIKDIINKSYSVDNLETTIAALNNIISTFYSVIIVPQIEILEVIKYEKDNALTKEFKDKSNSIFKKEINTLIKNFIPIDLYKNCSYYFTTDLLGIYIYNRFVILSKAEE